MDEVVGHRGSRASRIKYGVWSHGVGGAEIESLDAKPLFITALAGVVELTKDAFSHPLKISRPGA
jgi:hypothetical protein